MEVPGVLVVAERTLFRQGLEALIASWPDFAVIGAAADAGEARRLSEREQPDLVVLDSELQRAEGGCDLIACLRAGAPRPAIIVIGEADLSAGSEAEAEIALCAERAQVLHQGAAAYVPARVDSGELHRILTAVAATRAWEEAAASSDAERQPKPTLRQTTSTRHRITDRERSIIEMVAQGFCNKEVAHRLGISTQTVKNHVSHLLEKLALADRTQLAVYAVEHHFEF